MRKIILLDQSNYVERSNQLLKYRNFLQYCSLFLRFQQNYFDSPTKLFYFLLYIQQNFRFLSNRSFRARIKIFTERIKKKFIQI